MQNYFCQKAIGFEVQNCSLSSLFGHKCKLNDVQNNTF